MRGRFVIGSGSTVAPLVLGLVQNGLNRASAFLILGAAPELFVQAFVFEPVPYVGGHRVNVRVVYQSRCEPIPGSLIYRGLDESQLALVHRQPRLAVLALCNLHHFLRAVFALGGKEDLTPAKVPLAGIVASVR